MAESKAIEKGTAKPRSHLPLPEQHPTLQAVLQSSFQLFHGPPLPHPTHLVFLVRTTATFFCLRAPPQSAHYSFSPQRGLGKSGYRQKQRRKRETERDNPSCATCITFAPHVSNISFCKYEVAPSQGTCSGSAWADPVSAALNSTFKQRHPEFSSPGVSYEKVCSVTQSTCTVGRLRGSRRQQYAVIVININYLGRI